MTPGRIRIGQWLFARYGGRFVFIARFLPILRNMAAVLAGTNAMAQHSFYFASATAASAWILCYGLAAYSFGEAFGNLASPAAAVLGLAAAATVLSVPVFIVRYEKRLQAKAERGLLEPGPALQPTAVGLGDERVPSDAARHGASGSRRTQPGRYRVGDGGGDIAPGRQGSHADMIRQFRLQ